VRALLSAEVGTRAAEGRIGFANRWFRAGTTCLVGMLPKFQPFSTGLPTLFQFSIPPRRMDTSSNPASERIFAALAERFSTRQIVTIDLFTFCISLSRKGSSAIGMLVAPAR
jgi:hypothetical protein